MVRDGKARFFDRSNSTEVWVPIADAQAAYDRGMQPVTPETFLKQEEAIKYDTPITSALMGAAGAATFGLSDLVAEKIAPEWYQKTRHYNPSSRTIGEIGGILGTLGLMAPARGAKALAAGAEMAAPKLATARIVAPKALAAEALSGARGAKVAAPLEASRSIYNPVELAAAKAIPQSRVPTQIGRVAEDATETAIGTSGRNPLVSLDNTNLGMGRVGPEPLATQALKAAENYNTGIRPIGQGPVGALDPTAPSALTTAARQPGDFVIAKGLGSPMLEGVPVTRIGEGRFAAEGSPLIIESRLNRSIQDSIATSNLKKGAIQDNIIINEGLPRGAAGGQEIARIGEGRFAAEGSPLTIESRLPVKQPGDFVIAKGLGSPMLEGVPVARIGEGRFAAEGSPLIIESRLPVKQPAEIFTDASPFGKIGQETAPGSAGWIEGLKKPGDFAGPKPFGKMADMTPSGGTNWMEGLGLEIPKAPVAGAQAVSKGVGIEFDAALANRARRAAAEETYALSAGEHAGRLGAGPMPGNLKQGLKDVIDNPLARSGLEGGYFGGGLTLGNQAATGQYDISDIAKGAAIGSVYSLLGQTGVLSIQKGLGKIFNSKTLKNLNSKYEAGMQHNQEVMKNGVADVVSNTILRARPFVRGGSVAGLATGFATGSVGLGIVAGLATTAFSKLYGLAVRAPGATEQVLQGVLNKVGTTTRVSSLMASKDIKKDRELLDSMYPGVLGDGVKEGSLKAGLDEKSASNAADVAIKNLEVLKKAVNSGNRKLYSQVKEITNNPAIVLKQIASNKINEGTMYYLDNIAPGTAMELRTMAKRVREEKKDITLIKKQQIDIILGKNRQALSMILAPKEEKEGVSLNKFTTKDVNKL